MRRRDIPALIASAAAVWPLVAAAQQPMPVIGWLSVRSPETENIPGRLGAFSAGPGRSRLCRGPERRDRIPLGGRPQRSTAGSSGRSGCSSGERDCRGIRRPCGIRRQGSDYYDTDRVLRWRPSPVGFRRQPKPAGQQHDRGRNYECRTDRKATRPAARISAGGSCDRRAGQSGQHRDYRVGNEKPQRRRASSRAGVAFPAREQRE